MSVRYKSHTRSTVRLEEVLNDAPQSMENEITKPLDFLIGKKLFTEKVTHHVRLFFPVDYSKCFTYCQWFTNNLIQD